MLGRAMADELPGASYHQADLADAAHAGDLVRRRRRAHHGRLDVLVNNAGEAVALPHADLKAATPEVWRRMMDMNLIAPWMLIAEAETGAAQVGRERAAGRHRQYRHPCRACGPRARPSPMPRPRPALHHATRLLALGPGARHPGQLRGARPRRDADDRGLGGAYELWNTRSPMKRAARPEDIADLVAALVANDYVTGEIVIADGGLNLT